MTPEQQAATIEAQKQSDPTKRRRLESTEAAPHKETKEETKEAQEEEEEEEEEPAHTIEDKLLTIVKMAQDEFKSPTIHDAHMKLKNILKDIGTKKPDEDITPLTNQLSFLDLKDKRLFLTNIDTFLTLPNTLSTRSSDENRLHQSSHDQATADLSQHTIFETPPEADAQAPLYKAVREEDEKRVDSLLTLMMEKPEIIKTLKGDAKEAKEIDVIFEETQFFHALELSFVNKHSIISNKLFNLFISIYTKNNAIYTDVAALNTQTVFWNSLCLHLMNRHTLYTNRYTFSAMLTHIEKSKSAQLNDITIKDLMRNLLVNVMPKYLAYYNENGTKKKKKEEPLTPPQDLFCLCELISLPNFTTEDRIYIISETLFYASFNSIAVVVNQLIETAKHRNILWEVLTRKCTVLFNFEDLRDETTPLYRARKYPRGRAEIIRILEQAHAEAKPPKAKPLPPQVKQKNV